MDMPFSHDPFNTGPFNDSGDTTAEALYAPPRPAITITSPLTPPPQRFSNVPALLEANVVSVLLFRNGLLQTDGADYTRNRSLVTMALPPLPTDAIVARVFALGLQLGGASPQRYIVPWDMPCTGDFDSVNPRCEISIGPTISGLLDGKNRVFTWGVALRRCQLWRNGLLQTINVDVAFAPNAAVFLPAATPQPGDLLTAYGW